MVNGVAPEIAVDGRLELRSARHPLLIGAVRKRLEDALGDEVVPIEIVHRAADECLAHHRPEHRR